MSVKPILVRVGATYGLNVKAGDQVHLGQRLTGGPNENGRLAAPVSGIVESIEFDGGSHEFLITIRPTP